MGLVNKVVPDNQLDAEVDSWCREIIERSPTAVAIAKRSFNADTDSVTGISALGMEALKLYYDSEESKEGVLCVQRKTQAQFADGNSAVQPRFPLASRAQCKTRSRSE